MGENGCGRLSTTSFVEPITKTLEIQAQPPFLLYRNERSRIRGFWFYDGDECERIGALIQSLREQTGSSSSCGASNSASEKALESAVVLTAAPVEEPPKRDIFKLLNKAKRDYDDRREACMTREESGDDQKPPPNVLNFFAAAKPTGQSHASSNSTYQHAYGKSLSVAQLEQQQRVRSPPSVPTGNGVLGALKLNNSEYEKPTTVFNLNMLCLNDEPGPAPSAFASSYSGSQAATAGDENTSLSALLARSQKRLLASSAETTAKQPPALMPPTMFESVSSGSAAEEQLTRQEQRPNMSVKGMISQTQFQKAFLHLLATDAEFLRKLHEAYLQFA